VRRFWIVGLLALWASGVGCSGVARRGEPFPGYRPGVMPPAPAPPQARQVLPPPERTAAAGSGLADADRGPGLSKFFPGIKKPTAEPVALASTGRPNSWFGLRKAKPSQVYATDARVWLDRGSEEPALLPVALQVPTSDRAVLPTSAEVVAPTPSAPPVNPTLAEGAKAADTLELPAPAAPEPLLNVPAAPMAAKAADVTAPPVVDPTEATRAGAGAPAPRERPRLESPPDAPAASAEKKPTPTVPATPDDQPVKSAPPIDPTKALTLPDPTLPASYSTATGQSGVAATMHHVGPVHASPQVSPTAQSTVPAPAKKWKRPCLRRAVRKVWKLGEYANPPTAAPH